MSKLPVRWQYIAAMLTACIIALVLLVLMQGGKEDPATVQIPVDVGPKTVTVVADPDNELEPGEQQEAKDAGVDLHEDTRDETPPGVPEKALEAGKEATQKLQRKELLKPERPAGAQSYSCRPRPVVNQSALSSKRVGVALHFTVSDPGSLNAIFGLFNRPSFGASSNYGFELFNGRCERWVPENRKAWAQGAANSAYVSIEIVSKDRSRTSWLTSPAFKRGSLAALVRDIAKRHGVPLRRVDPRGCVFIPGLVDHDSLECGNSHWDVGKNFPWDVLMVQVRRGTEPNPLTVVQRKACDTLNFHRHRAHAIGKWSPERLERAKALKKQIPSGRCLSKYRKR